MSKIGDLFVRLGLKTDDYKKGMKEAKKETSSFGTSLKDMKAGAIAVWAAIGASVIKFGQQVLSATNRVGDAWARMTAGLKAGWDTFVQAVSNFDFNGLVGKINSASAAARNLQNAMDAQFEGKNSIQLQRALMSEELEALRIAMRDQTKSNKERLAAAEEYLRKVKPIYEQEVKLAKDLMDAQAGSWLAGTNLKDNAATREDLMKFLVDYSSVKNGGMVSDVAQYLSLEKEISAHKKMAFDPRMSKVYERNIPKNAENERQLAEIGERLKQWGSDNGYTNSIADLARIYENWRGDAQTQPLVEAIINAFNAEAGLNRETRMVQTIKNSLTAEINKERDEIKKAEEELAQKVLDVRSDTLKTFESEMEKLDNAIADINSTHLSIEIPDIDLSALDIADEAINQFIEQWQAEQEQIAMLNETFSNTMAESIGGGVQAFTEMLFDLDNADPSQVLAALVKPFADTAVQLGGMLIAQGVAVEAFKTSLASLQGGVAIAAGVALVAIGTAMSAGIKALAGGGGASASSASAYDSGSYQSEGYETYGNNIVVEVVGKISGSDILIAGSKQQNKWNR